MTEGVIEEIIDSISDVEDVEPAELDLTLYDHIDTDLVERLAKSEKGSWQLVFDVPGYTVTVSSDGSVLVDPNELTSPRPEGRGSPRHRTAE